MRRGIIAFFLPLLLGGCLFSENAHIVAPYDKNLAVGMLQGKNTITGMAAMQNSGGVLTCENNPVYLIPATTYAFERMETIYGNATRAFIPSENFKNVNFLPDPPDYHVYTLRTVCEPMGYFRFENVGDGEFFLVTSVGPNTPVQAVRVVNRTAVRAYPGGNMMQRITVRGGQTVDIIMEK